MSKQQNSKVVPAKKTEKRVERPGLSQDEVEEIRQAFDLSTPTEPEKLTLRNLRPPCNPWDLILRTPPSFN